MPVDDRFCAWEAIRDDTNRVEKVWGYEEQILNTPLYCYKKLYLPNTLKCSSIHYHENKIETFICVSGIVGVEVYRPKENRKRQAGSMAIADFVDHDIVWLEEGNLLTLNAFTAHRFWGILNSGSVFAEVSTHDDPADSYRLTQSGDLPNYLIQETLTYMGDKIR